MPEFSEQTSLYEIVVRVQEDGSYGAHYMTITRFRRDGEVFGAKEGLPTPLVAGNAEAFALLGQYVESAALDTLAVNQVLQARVIELEQQQQATSAELQQALEANQALQARVAELEQAPAPVETPQPETDPAEVPDGTV
ncbi:hypothetical protein PZ739_06015 [Pseudomonas kermanshahensis]|uniref:hypothetical protein n=1 Tax=Pseudomonas TaxID=286 RepID=UPI000A0ECE3C|nr:MULTISPECIES: hypothetical protein [Pseudomonas]WEL56722.1 hypothetical protein PZ739_06015 [Pseudomonas kermanshahensis]SMF35997.1 hypothetical protein SAMN02745962_03293 [Pseudomonas sp. LAIL14HWK12:I11]SMR79002.1 hypothetical protein SAMN05661028_03808 [Pseudomonas sp. LAIL14HWK12:I10]SOD04760.1 hypothetical protein SAMN05660296_03357 [Pseudomonas sp. LAIL14HWK12:I8]